MDCGRDDDDGLIAKSTVKTEDSDYAEIGRAHV